MKEFRITPVRHFSQLRHLLILVLGTILILFFMYGMLDSEQFLSISTIFGFLIFVVLILPTLVLHIKYLSINWHQYLRISHGPKQFTYYRIEKKSDFKESQIDYCFQVSTPTNKKGMIYAFPWDAYFYYAIFLKDGTKFVITSLLIDQKIPISKDRIIHIEDTFPWPDLLRLEDYVNSKSSST